MAIEKPRDSDCDFNFIPGTAIERSTTLLLNAKLQAITLRPHEAGPGSFASLLTTCCSFGDRVSFKRCGEWAGDGRH